MAITEDLIVRLQVDSKGAVRGTKIAVDGLKGLKGEIKKTETAFDKLTKQLNNVVIPVVALNQAFGVLQTVTSTLGRVVGATLGNFADFETALVGVAKTTDLSNEELAVFGETIQNLSEDIPVSANQLLKFAEIAGQLGVRGTENLENFAETMAKIEVSTNLAGEEAAKQFTRILTVTKEGIENIDEFASVIVRLGNNFAANEQEITRVTTEVARSIGIFKGSAAEAAALATALRVLGNRAELGGTVVGRVFRAIDSTIQIGTDAAKKNISELTGIATEDLRKAFEEDAAGAFVKFLEGLKAVEEAGGSLDLTLQQFKLTGDEINKVIPALTTRLDVFKDALNQANEEVNDAKALNEEAERAFGTLTSSVNKLTNTVRNIGIGFGAFFAPAIQAAIELLNSILTPIGTFIDIANDLFEALFLLAGAKGLGLLIANASKFLPLLIKIRAVFLTTVAPVIFLAGKIILIATALQLVIDNVRVFKDLFVAGFKVITASVVKLGEQLFKITDALGITEGAAEAAAGVASVGFEEAEKTFRSLDESINTDSLETMTEVAFKLGEAIGLTDTEFVDAANSSEKLGKKGTEALEDIERKVEPVINTVGDVEKAIRDVIREFDNLIKATKQLEMTNALAFKTGRDRFITAQALRMAEIDAIESQLRILGELEGKEKDIIRAREAVREGTRIQILQDEIDKADELFETNQKNIQKLEEENLELANNLAMIGLDAEERAEKMLEIEIDALKKRQEALDLTQQAQRDINSLIEEQIKLLNQTSESQQPTDLGDFFGGATDVGGQIFSMEAVENAFSAAEGFARDIESLNKKSKEEQNEIVIAGAKKAGNALLDAGGALIDDLGSITFESIGEAIVTAASTVVDIMSGLISGEFVEQMTSVVNAFADFPSKMLEVFGNLGSALQNFAQTFPQLVNQFVESFPSIISAIIDAIPMVVDTLVENLPRLAETLIQGIVTAIPTLAKGIAEVFPVLAVELAKAIGPIISALIEALPTLITGLLEGITQAIPFLVEGIVQAFFTLVEIIPDIVMAIVDALPSLIEKLAEAIPILAFKFVEGIIKFFFEGGAEKVIRALIKAIPKLITALVKGIGSGLAKIFGGFNLGIDTSKFKEFGRKVTEGVTKIAKEATGAADELFNVLDSKRAADKANFLVQVNDAADRIKDSFDEGGKSVGLRIKEAWDKVIDFFKNNFGKTISEAWKGLIDFFKNLGKLIGQAWSTVIDFFSNFGENISNAWKTVLEELKRLPDNFKKGFESFIKFGKGLLETLGNLLSGLGKFFEGFFKNIIQPILDTIGNALLNVINFIGDGVEAAFNLVLGGFETFFNNLKTKIFDPIVNAFSGLFDPLVDAVRRLTNLDFKVDFAKAFKGDGEKGTIEKTFGFDVPGKFQDGGFVPSVPGLTSPTTDSFPALLQPGEFVINRPSAQALGPNLLTSLNQGMVPTSGSMGSPTFNIELRIENQGQNVDETFVRTRIMPTIMDAIRESSLDGRFIMATGGIR